MLSYNTPSGKNPIDTTTTQDPAVALASANATGPCVWRLFENISISVTKRDKTEQLDEALWLLRMTDHKQPNLILGFPLLSLEPSSQGSRSPSQLRLKFSLRLAPADRNPLGFRREQRLLIGPFASNSIGLT